MNCPFPDCLTDLEQFVVQMLVDGFTVNAIDKRWKKSRIEKMHVLGAIKNAHRKLGLGLAGRKEHALIVWRAKEIGKAIGRSERLSGELQANREREAQLPARRLGPRPAHLTST